MKTYIIHISDLHFRKNWEEDQELVISTFFNDLEKQLLDLDKNQVYLLFSGDIVREGFNNELYELFYSKFDKNLNDIGIAKDHRICVPGNHDLSIECVKENFEEHDGVILKNMNEKEFNDYIDKNPPIIINKFNNYLKFQNEFADFGINDKSIAGLGHNLNEGIGVYCLNSSLFSSGKFNNINDSGRLAIYTRGLQKWTIENEAKTKILVLHHPINWLNEWSQTEIKNILKTKFALCLSGHKHDQELNYTINNNSPIIECSSPPLLTYKYGNLGYSIITISEIGVMEIYYRQWTKHHSFVTGVNFSNTDNGKVIISNNYSEINFIKDEINRKLTMRFDESLNIFSSKPIWIDPVISKSNDLIKNADDNTEELMDINEFIKNPHSSIIKAPPQFGLTCLANYFAKFAWEKHTSFWLYLDAKTFKPHKYEKAIIEEISEYGIEEKSIKCIIIDSWTCNENESIKLLKSLCEKYKNIPIVVMQTIEDGKFISELNSEIIDREFQVYHLLSLPRNQIRKFVSDYNAKKYIGEENIVLTKILNDLEVLNIHRTPLNCLTLLKVSEKYFDESPLNRTKMLEMVLFLLFNNDGLPTYKNKPDLKDCEYVIGRFCENMIKNDFYYFSKEDFIKEIKTFCDEKLMDIEVNLVFDILHTNNIIIKSGIQYRFRFIYWIFYFVAQRMHQDEEFAKYIFSESRYSSYPEVIEFYTGIDRNREDALKILMNDVKTTCDIVKDKVGMPEDFNPFKYMTWKPNPGSFEKIESELSESVLKSKLPDAIKDKYADRGYNQLKPYDQNIHKILNEYSVELLIQEIKAASRALRNSDYVNPELKCDLLS